MDFRQNMKESDSQDGWSPQCTSLAFYDDFNCLRPVKCACPTLANLKAAKYCSAAAKDKTQQTNDVVIPHYIPRGPTDILEALATTIKRDPTAAHYKFHDDPYLYPTSNFKKRVFALSQEAGRKAAIWVRQEHQDLFMYRESDPPDRKLFYYENADPPIAAYIPKPDYTQQEKVDEDDLKITIKNNLINDSITVYKLLEAKTPGSISPETMQSFLELLCYFNETEPLSEEWMEERWFADSNRKNANLSKWKNSGLAMKIFGDLPEKSTEAYCTIIQGMCKYIQPHDAYKLYNECRKSGKSLSTTTYNCLLSIVPYLKESFEMQWQMTQDLLNDMNSQGLSPNVITLNNILHYLDLSNHKEAKEYSLNLISEFVNECSVEPSLASWHYILNIFYKEKNSKNDVLHTIINKLEGKSLKIHEPRDVLFFSNAMNKCRYSLYDLKLAKKIHELVMYQSNYDLIGDSTKEAAYYRNFFTLILRTGSVDSVLEFYDSYVPNVYIPEAVVMEELIRLVDINGVNNFYPQLWSHMIMFGHNKRESTVLSLLESLVRNLPPVASPQKGRETSQTEVDEVSDTTVKSVTAMSDEENFGNIALHMWSKAKEDIEFSSKFIWRASMLSDIVMLLTRAGKVKEAQEIVRHLSESGGALGVPSTPDSIIYFSNAAIEAGYPSSAVIALNYLSECGFSEPEHAAKELLQKVLNRPESDINELLASSLSRGTEDESEVVSNLISIAKNKSSGIFAKSKNETSSSSSSDSSSDTSESDGSEDDLDVKETK